MLEHLINEVEKFLNVSLIKEEKKDHTRYLLTLNDETEIWFEEKDEQITLTSNICPFKEKNLSTGEEFYSYLMQANYIGIGTGNSVIAIDKEEKFLTLVHRIDYEVNYKLFRDVIEDFANYISFWRKEISKKV